MRKHLTYANVMATLAVVLVVAGGTAYAANTIGSEDVIDNSLGSRDLKDNAAVQGPDVRNGTLKDEDIAQSGGSVVNFEQAINVVSPHLCKFFNLLDTGADEDHMLLTPSGGDSDIFLTYSIEYPPFDGAFAGLKVCNPTDMAIDDKKTHFNLLVIDAQ